MAGPLVSIIVPCYRQAHYLPAALASVLGQRYQPVEIITVNDGSDDDTEAVLRGYGSRVRYVSQPNGGLASARNAGIRVAQGQYLLFLDADDLLHPEAVGWLVEALAGREDRVGVMGFRKFRTDPVLGDGPDALPPGERPLERRVIFECLGPPHTHLCPRALAVRFGGFDDRWKNACEDWDFWRRLALAGTEFVAVPHVGAYYRRYEGSMSTNRLRTQMMNVEILLGNRRAVAANPELLRRWGYSPAEVRGRFRALLQEFMVGAAYRLQQEGRFHLALAYYAGSIYRGGWSYPAALGLAKLLPHFVVRQGRRLLRRSCPAG